MTPIDPDRLGEDRSLSALVALIAAEAEALAELIPAAEDAQWHAAPHPRPREDTTERASGGHSDPTATIAADELRLALRLQVMKSERLLQAALVNVSGVRRGLEKTLALWQGEA